MLYLDSPPKPFVIKTMPLFYDGDGKPVGLENFYKGAAAFLICGGPSLASINLDKIRVPGLLTMGVNNSIKIFRPNLGCVVDDPANFVRSLWFDPTITKFARQYYTRPHYKDNGENSSLIFDSDAWSITDIEVKNCPATLFYRHNSDFCPEQFLSEETICWGDVGGKTTAAPGDGRGPNVRSVMLVALKILYRLGIRQVYLLGADFKMTAESSYAFFQKRDRINIDYNNRSYEVIDERLNQLKPYFEAAGFKVFNSTEGSMLKAFDTVPYDEAIERVLEVNRMNFDLSQERTDGLYDRQAQLKLEKQDQTYSLEPIMQVGDEASQASKALIARGVSVRKFSRLSSDFETWVVVAADLLLVGDRIRIWEPDGKTRIKSRDGVSEWTLGAINAGMLGLVHWRRETHMRHVNSGELMDALGAYVEK